MLNLTKSIFAVIVFSMNLLLASASNAKNDPGITCESAASLFKESDLEGALEEARWCVTQLEQLKQG
jgi:hypothetical protein